MNPFSWIYLYAGLGGGLLRGLVGISKAISLDKRKVNPNYLVFSLLVAALVGISAGVLANQNWQFAFLAGYAGTDFLEGLYKLKFGQIFKR